MILALVLLLLVLIGMPLFAALGAATLGHSLDMPYASAWDDLGDPVIGGGFADSRQLMVVPLVAFAACVLREAGGARRLGTFVRAWLGWLPGSSALGAPDSRQALALLAPFSVPLISYALMTQLVLDMTVLIGVLPATLLCAAVVALGASTRAGTPRARFSWSDARRALGAAKWELGLAGGLLVGLARGLLPAQGVAALGALGVIALELFVHHGVHPRRDLPRIALQAIRWSGAVLLLFAMALSVHGWSRESAPVMSLLELLAAHDASTLAFLLLGVTLVALASALIEPWTALLVVAPLLWPTADRYGVDPYQLAVIALLSAELGRLRPPLRARLPLAIALLAVLLIVVRIPAVSTLPAYRLIAPAH